MEQRFIAKFNEKYQNVTIEYERFGYGVGQYKAQAGFAAGIMADII